ncbi:universal stress protein [Streptomyces sp. OM5714]|uniref:universal stress protein n=1 Tax=Streptomyces sp. OM5714 TaxID=2602736 RepID=UPI0013DAB1A0|nr:universal stress protein [Streptomyces sp. OM5714]KAF2776435.1 stress-inducible protein [Streptomyces sp. OM5714]
MTRTITVGIDGSPESHAAAEWAAREAGLRDLPVRLLHVWEPVPAPMAEDPILGTETHQYWTEHVPRRMGEGLRLRHPGVEVSCDQRSGPPANTLVEAVDEAELLVLGSRALSGLGGYLVGSVGQSVIAHTEIPVVLVRAGEMAADEHVMDPAGIPSAATAFRPVVVGIDIDDPDDDVLAFAFEEAQRRRTALHVVSGWQLPPHYPYMPAAGSVPDEGVARRKAADLTRVILPWRQKYPDVEVVEVSRSGSPARHLVDVAHDASLVVVGRRIRRNPLGAHVGAVTHAVLHHATAPVAVVAHP